MTALTVVEAPSSSVDPLTAHLEQVLVELGAAVRDDDVVLEGGACPDAVRIDRVAVLQRLRAGVAALQMAESVRFARSQTAVQVEQGVDPRAVGRGIADQLALACGVSPFTGSRRLGVARALWLDLPQTFALLTAGDLSEQVAEAVVAETSHLDATTRRRVDADLVTGGISDLSFRQAVARVRKVAYEADRVGYVNRGRKARTDRRVTCRPAPDTMSLVSGYLPVEQGVACLAALRTEADARAAAGDARTRDQVMADTFVERVTGQTRAEDVNLEVQIVVPWEALIDPDCLDPDPDLAGTDTTGTHASNDSAGADTAGTDTGYDTEPAPVDPDTATAASTFTADPDPDHQLVGFVDGEPVPAELVREMIASTRGRVWWRRLFTRPTGAAWTGSVNGTQRPDGREDGSSTGDLGRVVVGGDRVRRRFDGSLAAMIRARDQRCRDPYCDAPIRHLDHTHRFADGGATTFENGRGVCARGNYVREMPGWTVEVVDDGTRGSPHRVRTTTPTGHVYESSAPDPP